MVAVYGGKLLDNPLLDVSSKTDLHVDGFGLDVGQEAFRLGCSLFLSLSLSLSLYRIIYQSLHPILSHSLTCFLWGQREEPAAAPDGSHGIFQQ